MKKIYILLWLGLLCWTSCQDDFNSTEEFEGKQTEKSVLWLSKTIDNTSGTRAVGVIEKYWKPGDTIQIKFLNGPQALQNEVKQYANLWLEYANIHFRYVTPAENADVKIGFDMDEPWIAWSTLGTDCKAVPQDEPSLNFAYLDSEEMNGKKAEVLRAFGHVLGLGFEHRHPRSPVVFKPTADIAGEYNLTPQQIADFTSLYLSYDVDTTSFDKNSVMAVNIPRSLVMSPTMSMTRNSELSAEDKAIIRKMYSPYALSLRFRVNTAPAHFCVFVFATDWSPIPGKTYDRKVDWGDGTWEYLPIDDRYSHYFESTGTFNVTFYGDPEAYQLFYLDRTPIQNIDISKCTELRTLNVSNGNLTRLNVSHNPKLTMLSCLNNPIRNLDITNNQELRLLYIQQCGMTELLMSEGYNDLEFVNCFSNSFTPAKLTSIVHSLRGADLGGGDIWVTDSVERGWIANLCEAKGWEVAVILPDLVSPTSNRQTRAGGFTGRECLPPLPGSPEPCRKRQ